MSKLFKSLPAILFLLFLGGCTSVPTGPELKTVGKVDLQKYLGTWYEIATIPAWFEKDLVGVTANYSLRPDGNIRVLNSGRKKTLDGPLKTAEGRAWIADGKDASKLKVSFFLWFAGDYWIIELDPEYRFVVVGDPSRQYLWVLSRTPKMDDALYAELLRRIAGHGYDLALIHKSVQ
jgi:lipocalin